MRWWGILKGLGHLVRVVQEGHSDFSACEVLIALHGIKSGGAIENFKRVHPHRPVVVVLTGTDFFQPGASNAVLQRSLALADRILVLQNHLATQLPAEMRDKVRVIFQSFAPPAVESHPDPDYFEVCVLGHLRAVKDPLLAARAARLLPAHSRIRITQVGGALESEQAHQADEELRLNPRYLWLGELPRSEAIRVLARCRVLVQSSLAEGGPSAVSEAVALGIPVLSTPTSGVVGLLGPDYPGLFPFSDPEALARLLVRMETDAGYHQAVLGATLRAKALVRPEREALAWLLLLKELS